VQQVSAHSLIYCFDNGLGSWKNPPVLLTESLFYGIKAYLHGVEVVKSHVRQREPEDVPENIDWTVDGFYFFKVELQVLPGCAWGKHICTEGIGSEPVYDVERRNNISKALGHLLSASVQCEAVHEHTLVRCSTKANHACPKLGIEPASGLVMSLCDKISRPPFIKLLVCLREFKGCPGSNSRVEPDIKDVFDTLLFSSAFTWDCDFVHIGAVKLDITACSGFFQKFGFCPYYLKLSAFTALPDRNRNSPVALPGDTPVSCAFNPGPESGWTCPFRVPVYSINFLKHPVLNFGNFEEPLLGCKIDDRSFAAPAVPVPVGHCPFCKEPVSFLQVFNDNGICFPYILARIFSGFLRICSIWAHWTEDRKPVFHTDVKVVHTMPGGNVYTACIFYGYEVGKVNAMLHIVLDRHQISNRAFVLEFCELFPEHRLKDFVVNIPSLFEDIFDQVRCCNKDFFRTVLFDCPELWVFEIRVHSYSHVCRNCPGSCRPDDNEGIFFSFNLEFHIDRRVGPFGIFDFWICNCSLTARAPVDRTLSNFQEVFFVGLLKGPPGSFDVIVF